MNTAVLENFIVFEGIDGTGTSTQLKKLAERCVLEGITVHCTYEPTDRETGQLIRKILKGSSKAEPRTLAYLFAADRSEHLYGDKGITELCADGIPVISDRYIFSSLAYQGMTCGAELTAMLNSLFPLPEILIYFSLDPIIADTRMQIRDSREIFETIPFQTKVRTQFDRVLEQYGSTGMKIHRIDASKTPEAIAEEIWTLCNPVFYRS